MPYTLLLDGRTIGTAELDAMPVAGHHAGLLHPTPHGLAVLPSITAMVPALFDFRTMCEARGIDTGVDTDDACGAIFDAFASSLEGRRVQAAASQIARVELRDPMGRPLLWRTLLVTDMDDLRALGSRRAATAGGAADGDLDAGADAAEPVPIRYLVSVTFQEAHAAVPAGSGGPRLAVAGAGPVC